jgi:hypothetical protein
MTPTTASEWLASAAPVSANHSRVVTASIEPPSEVVALTAAEVANLRSREVPGQLFTYLVAWLSFADYAHWEQGPERRRTAVPRAICPGRGDGALLLAQPAGGYRLVSYETVD